MPMIVHHNETAINDQGITLSYVIKNVGTGPALVTDRYFDVHGQKFAPKEPSKLIKELCELLIGSSLSYRILSSGMIGQKGKIPGGAEITLLKLFFPGLREDQVQIVEALANKADFIIKYQSIYGEPFSYHSGE